MPHGVRVERNRLRFAAGHFATFADELEPIHGHNYDVIVEVEGPLSDESWVVDFSRLKSLTRDVCATLDHKFLLQMNSRVLAIRDDGAHYEIQYRDQPSYRLPKQDVAALPIDNSTAERLAEYIAGRLTEALSAPPVYPSHPPHRHRRGNARPVRLVHHRLRLGYVQTDGYLLRF